jgi:hypothetical protein
MVNVRGRSMLLGSECASHERNRVTSAERHKMPKYRNGRWIGGDARRLYTFIDRRTGRIVVRAGDAFSGIGPEADVREATRGEAETLWQSPLHPGWKVSEANSTGQPNRVTHTPRPGYAYVWEPETGEALRKGWERSRSDDWNHHVLGGEQFKGAVYLGTRRIDDIAHRVWRLSDDRIIAQVKLG